MSRDLNKLMVSGRLGRDPEIKFLDSGKVLTTFSVAANRRWRDGAGELHDEAEWFQVVTWDGLAEFCGDYLRKGSRALLEGRLQTRSWDDPESGVRRFRTELVASDIILLDPCDETDDRTAEVVADDLAPAAPESSTAGHSRPAGRRRPAAGATARRPAPEPPDPF